MTQTLEGLQTEILAAIARSEGALKEELSSLKGEISGEISRVRNELAGIRAAVQMLGDAFLANSEKKIFKNHLAATG